ncbi:hypothetical protein [Kribbella sp. NPDC048915]|uniref:hypothetical protein n=1 Tax=Kribbella sp. NPDC048915 TaxID=3155148 RepID=UPI0033C81660
MAPDSREITINEWFRPADLLWLAVGVLAIATGVWVLASVPEGDFVEVGNNSAYPQGVDTHRAPLLVPLIAVLGFIGLKFGLQLRYPLAARIDRYSVKLYARTGRLGLRFRPGPPLAEAPWDAISRIVLRYRRTKVLNLIPTRTTVLTFERPNGKPYGHTATLSPWSLPAVAAATARFAPQIQVTDERNPNNPRIHTP